MSADKIIHGNIITMEAGRPIQEAMTIVNGRIQFVGTYQTALALCDDKTQVIDFGNNYIYPGIIEGHCHPDLAGIRMKLQADLTAGQTMAEYIDFMKAFIEANPGFGEYRGAGWSERECKPTAAMLDAICPDAPVVLNSIDGHSMWLNTPALAKYGIDQAAVEYWGTDVIRIDEEGKPTGYISEGPCTEIIRSNEYTAQQRETAWLAWQDFAFAQGLTAVMHAGITEESCLIYKSLIDKGLWHLRTYGVVLLDEHEEDYTVKVKLAQELAEKYNNEYFKVIGVKIFMDGVIEAHTAWLLEAYEDAPEDTGVKRMCDFNRVTELFKAATQAGMLVHCHTIGDGAIKFAIDCIEAAEKETGDFTARHALSHLQLMRPEDIKRMADLRIIPVVAPLWSPKEPAYYPQTLAYLGQERAEREYPIQSFVDYGAPIVFHSDFPVSTDMGIPRTMYTAVTRTAPEFGPEGVLGVEQAVSRQDALAAMTTNAAYSIKQEDTLGKLAPGYYADFSVFDKDFLTDDIEEVAKATLVATYVGGEQVYSA